MPQLRNPFGPPEAVLQHVGRMEQVARVLPVTLGDGPGAGVRAFDVDNGSGLRFLVLADRALDIGEASYKGINLAWMSPAGVMRPTFYEPQGREWLRTFAGGLLTTCGLTNVGPPAQESGDGAIYGMHGRISTLPAENVSHGGAWENGEYVLRIAGQVRQGALYRENLILHRTITLRLGEPKIEIETIVENAGYERSPLMILFHCNLGWPLVDAGTRLEGNFVGISPRDEEAAKGKEQALQFQEPTVGYLEKAYFLDAADKKPRVSFVNDKLPLRVSFTYDKSELTHLTEWKMMGQGIYVVGVEPGNCWPISITKTRERGELQMLAPGEKKRFALTIEVSS